MLYPIFPESSKLPAGGGAAAIMIVQNAGILPLGFGVSRIITASWTLSFIGGYYLISYPVASLTKRLRTHMRITIWTAISIAVYFLLGRPFLLPLGAVLCEVAPRLSLRPIWLVLCSGVLLRAIPQAPAAGLLGSAVAVSALCLWGLRKPSVSKAAAFLSRISYSFYLTNGLAIVLVEHLTAPPPLAVMVAFIAAVAGSYVVYEVVEKRFLPGNERPVRHYRGSLEVRAKAA